MSYGSDTEGGASDNVGGAPPSSTPPPSNDTPNFPDSPPSYDYTPTDTPDDSYYSLANDTPTLNFGFGDYGYGEGAKATTVPGLYTQLGTTSTTDPFTKSEDGFWGSKAQKMLSFFANLNPVTGVLNSIFSAANSPDPAKAAIQGLLGRFGGDLGRLGLMGYNASQSKDPTATGAGYAGSWLGGKLGGALAGDAGAQFGSSVLGGATTDAARSQAYSATEPAGLPGSVSGDILGGKGSSYGAPSVTTQRGDASQGRNWTDTAMSLLSGIYGMKQSNSQRDLASVASAPSQAASVQLQKAINGDFSGDAGYEAALKAAARAGSQQPGGFAASAAAQAALKYQNDRINTLSGATNSGVSTALSGNNSANALASASLGSLGFGTSSGTSMPAWLQAYMIKNGLGGTSNA